MQFKGRKYKVWLVAVFLTVHGGWSHIPILQCTLTQQGDSSVATHCLPLRWRMAACVPNRENTRVLLVDLFTNAGLEKLDCDLETIDPEDQEKWFK